MTQVSVHIHMSAMHVPKIESECFYAVHEIGHNAKSACLIIQYRIAGHFRGGQLAHENNEYFTPRKLPAIRYNMPYRACHVYTVISDGIQ